MVKFIESELILLKKEIDEMWTLVYNQLDRAGEAVLTLDKELAQQVMVRERRVNAFELKIDSDVEDIIALYNPVAIDLRFVLAMLKRFGCVCRLKHFTPVDIPVIFVAEEKENVAKSANNPLAAVLGAVNTAKQIPPTLTFNADNEMVQTLLQIQGDNKLFQHVVHILYVQSLLQGKYPVNSEEMELFNRSLSELMTSKMNDFINFLN